MVYMQIWNQNLSYDDFTEEDLTLAYNSHSYQNPVNKISSDAYFNIFSIDSLANFRL
jgi:hypothetical protein